MNRNARRNAIAAVMQVSDGIPDEPINDLANAIVLCAANDYRTYCQRKKALEKKKKKQDVCSELFDIELKIGWIERFFASDWCFALSGGTNIAILERLRREQK